MTSPNLPAPTRQKLEARAPEVIAMLLDGSPERAVAKAFGASKQGVALFKQRHAAELKDVKAELVETVKADWISDKAIRIAKLQKLAEMTDAEIDEYGLTTEKVTMSEDGGPHFTREYRASMVREMRGILKDVGELLGQMPKQGDTFNDNRTVVYIREVHTGGAVPLG